MQYSIHTAPPPAPQMANRLRGAQHQRALISTRALPGGTREFSLQITDLTQGWSDRIEFAKCPFRLASNGSKRFYFGQTTLYSWARLPPHTTLAFKRQYLAPSEWIEINRLRCAL